jgi:hypothetical protein
MPPKTPRTGFLNLICDPTCTKEEYFSRKGAKAQRRKGARAQGRKGAKRYRVSKDFLCAFAPLRENLFVSPAASARNGS